MSLKVNTSSSPVDWASEVKQTLFDITYSDSHKSAIDSFLEKNMELNAMIIDPGGCQKTINKMIIDGEIAELIGRKIIAKLATPQVNYKLMNLVLLGYVSSVEGYMRQIIRDLVNLDECVRASCELQKINFGATFYQNEEMYPESLMDEITFISSSNIISTCKLLLGISIDFNNKADLKKAFDDYNSICQLRHCIVHRFGKIGATNAIKIGMNEKHFKNCLEKPIQMDFDTIQKVSRVTVNLIKEINQYLWEKIMDRIANDKNPKFTWDLRNDKKLFSKYLRVFYETTSISLEDNLRNIYIEFKKTQFNSKSIKS